MPTLSAAKWGGAVAAPTVLLFVATGIHRSFSDALDILTGSVSPFAVHAGALGALLALDGYLLLPAVVGVVVAVAFARSVDRRRNDDVPAQVEELVSDLFAKRSKQEAGE